MILVLFTYEVPAEKHDDYLKVTKDEIKPFWESHGCESYHVWQSSEAPTNFVKEMVFKDMTAMKDVMALAEAEPIKKRFFGFATNISRSMYERRT